MLKAFPLSVLMSQIGTWLNLLAENIEGFPSDLVKGLAYEEEELATIFAISILWIISPDLLRIQDEKCLPSKQVKVSLHCLLTHKQTNYICILLVLDLVGSGVVQPGLLNQVELTKHITPHANGEPLLSGAPHIHILPHFCLLSGLPTVTLLPRHVQRSIY